MCRAATASGPCVLSLYRPVGVSGCVWGRTVPRCAAVIKAQLRRYAATPLRRHVRLGLVSLPGSDRRSGAVSRINSSGFHSEWETHGQLLGPAGGPLRCAGLRLGPGADTVCACVWGIIETGRPVQTAWCLCSLGCLACFLRAVCVRVQA